MKRHLVLSATLLLLCSCSLTPDYSRPELSMPSETQWEQASQAQSYVDEATRWWTYFESDELNAIIAQALAQNTDLRAGVHRIEQARASLKSAGASLLPSVDGSAGGSRSKSNPASGKSTYNSSLNAGVSVSYEVDLFGANRAEVDAAEAGYEGSIYDQGALKLTVMGDVATGYFTLINLRERLKIADENLDNAKEVLRIIQARVNSGVESELALAQQKSAVASSEASRASLAEQVANAQNALSVLLGQPPGDLVIERASLVDITIPEIAAGQPSALLQRRPDILSVESSLVAANADIGAARAAFYPSVSLGLSNSISLAGFGDPSSTALSLASSLVTSIFSGGALDAQLERVSARQLELAETYRGTVYTAFQDVEDALVAVNTAQTREDALLVSMQQAERAYDISKRRYDAGSIDYQTLLDTQNSKLSAQDSYAQARLARLTTAVNLYRALGGGWASE